MDCECLISFIYFEGKCMKKKINVLFFNMFSNFGEVVLRIGISYLYKQQIFIIMYNRMSVIVLLRGYFEECLKGIVVRVVYVSFCEE